MTPVTELLDVPCIKIGMVLYGNRSHTPEIREVLSVCRQVQKRGRCHRFTVD